MTAIHAPVFAMALSLAMTRPLAANVGQSVLLHTTSQVNPYSLSVLVVLTVIFVLLSCTVLKSFGALLYDTMAAHCPVRCCCREVATSTAADVFAHHCNLRSLLRPHARCRRCCYCRSSLYTVMLLLPLLPRHLMVLQVLPHCSQLYKCCH